MSELGHEKVDGFAEPVPTAATARMDDQISMEPDEALEKESNLLELTKSYATTASAMSTRPSSVVTELPEKKPWYRSLNPLKIGPPPPVPTTREVSREHTASFFSMVYFQWMAPVMTVSLSQPRRVSYLLTHSLQVGYKRPLEKNDIWTVNPERTAELLTEKMKSSFNVRRARGEKYPLFFALHDTFKTEFWIGGICQLCSNIFQVFSPFTLRYLIAFATEAYIAAEEGVPGPHIAKGIGLVIGITFMQMLQSLGTNHFIYRGMMVGGQSRTVLVSMIFEKAMTISGRARAGGMEIRDIPKGEEQTEGSEGEKGGKSKEGAPKKGQGQNPDAAKGVYGDGTGWHNGRVVSLMSVDASRVDIASGMFHLIWTAPVACIITLILLIVNLTYSGVAGFAVFMVGLPLITKAVKALLTRRRAINKITDQRVSLTQEILQSVRFVKFFGWESSFLSRLAEIRKREITSIQFLLGIRNGINSVSLSMPIFASMVAFIVYSVSNHNLSASHVFSSLALFNSLKLPLNMLPLVIGQVVDALGSLYRIQEYLMSEDQEESSHFDADAKNAVELENANFTWERIATQDAEGGKRLARSKKQGKEEIKAEKAAHKQTIKDAKAASKLGGPAAVSADDTSTLVGDRDPFKLQNMDFSIGRNELVAVIGGVGSGKSSLLAALAGDMRKTKGDMTLGASRAFCPQYAWIQNASVKDNIIFGKDLDKKWYFSVYFCFLHNSSSTNSMPLGLIVDNE
jgi:ATP-binding cassette subfamily C (CFTR/MRP) protein 1